MARALLALSLVVTLAWVAWDRWDRRVEGPAAPASGPIVAPRTPALPSPPSPPPGATFTVDFSVPSAAAYEGPAALRELGARAEARLSRTFGERVGVHAGLGCAARELAHLHAEGEAELTGGLVDAALHRCGVPYPRVRRYFYFRSDPDDEAFLAYFEEALGKEEETGFRLVGLGRYDGARDERFAHTYVGLSLAPRLSLDPVPRQPTARGRLQLSGYLAEDLGDPHVFVLRPGDEVEDFAATETGDGGFVAGVELAGRAGELWIEILGTGPAGPEVLALFPLYVDMAPPSRYTGRVPPEEGHLGDPGELAILLWDLVNADRRRHGLPALQWDNRLANVALGHAEDMRDRSYVAHVSPDGRGLRERVEAAGYAFRAVGENVARNRSVYSAEESLMRSLGHRVNILATKFTHVGIGVAIEERLGGGRYLYVVQNFSMPR